jgi:hypothetical protein
MGTIIIDLNGGHSQPFCTSEVPSFLQSQVPRFKVAAAIDFPLETGQLLQYPIVH